MDTHFRSRPRSTWRYALPAVLVTAAVAATLVPAQAVAQVNPATTVEEDQDFPLLTTPDPWRTDPEVAAVAGAAADAFKYSTAVVAADPTRVYPEGSVEAILQAGMLTMPAEVLREATGSAQAMVNADVEARMAEFGQYGRNDWNTHARLGFAGAFQTDTLPVDPAALTARLTSQADQLAIEGRAAERQINEEADKLGVDPSTIKRVKALALDITSVKCFETTDWEWFSDEIEMGGVVVGSDGVSKKVPPFMVHDDFDAGEIITYGNGGKRFSTLDMSQDGVWPRYFSHAVFISEKDALKGFSDALTTAWEKIKGIVQAAIEKVVGGLLSVYFGPAIAGAIGKAVAWLINTFIGWLIKLFKDDVFAPRHVNLKLPSNAEFMYTNPIYLGWDNHRSPTWSAYYEGFGGKYRGNLHAQVLP